MFRAPVEIASVVPRSGTKSSDTARDREVEGSFSTTPEAKQLWRSRQSCVPEPSVIRGIAFAASVPRAVLKRSPKGSTSRCLQNLVESTPVRRRTYVAVGTDREIKYGHVGEAGAVKAPVCSAVGGIEDATISASVEMART